MPSKRLGGIAIVVHNIDSVGGMERQAMHLAERLAARGLRVMIVTSRIEPRFRLLPRLTKPWHEWRGPIEIIRAPAFPNWTSEAVRRLIDVIVTYALLRHRKRIDAIYAVQFTGCEYSAFAAKATGIPAVVKFACGGAPGDFQSIARREDAEQLHAALRCMARYVIISDEIQKEAEEAGLNPALFVRIRNGVDTKRFSPAASPATLPELSWPERKLILFVGRHDRQKRLDVLLRAFARVRDAIPEARLVSAGPAPSLEEYLSLARELGIEKEVTFLGARTDVAGLYRAASVFVLPSAAEGLPNALLEALASGTPCVATEIPGTTDVVTHEKEALLVPVDDVDALARAIVRLLRDDGLARRLAEAGRARVMAEFDMERVADQYFELFTKLPRIATRARWAQDARTQLRFASALGRKTASFLFAVGLLHARDVTTALVVGVKRFLGIEREILPRRRRAPSKPDQIAARAGAKV